MEAKEVTFRTQCSVHEPDTGNTTVHSKRSLESAEPQRQEVGWRGRMELVDRVSVWAVEHSGNS